MAAIDTFRLEQTAEDRGRDEATLINLMGTVGQLSRDVRHMMLVLVPVACSALLLSIVTFILVLVK